MIVRLSVSPSAKQSNAFLASDRKPDVFVVRIERDYREAHTAFDTTYPVVLESIVSREAFDETITAVNRRLREAETLTRHDVLTNVGHCVFCFICMPCTPNAYERIVADIGKYIQERNATVFEPRDVQWQDPYANGYIYMDLYVRMSRKRGEQFAKAALRHAEAGGVDDDDTGAVSSVRKRKKRKSTKKSSSSSTTTTTSASTKRMAARVRKALDGDEEVEALDDGDDLSSARSSTSSMMALGASATSIDYGSDTGLIASKRR